MIELDAAAVPAAVEKELSPSLRQDENNCDCYLPSPFLQVECKYEL